MKSHEFGGATPQETQTQYAALCFRRDGKGALEILLITSRDTGRWVIPKGWPMAGKGASQCALREAFEEAGVEGRTTGGTVGLYTYDKVLAKGVQPCIVSVFPVEVDRLRDEFPEKGQRVRRWFKQKKAAARVDEPELKSLILGFEPKAAPEGGDAAGA